MDFRVLGCHGGETPRHRTTAFLIDERLTIDAGCLTSQLELADQVRLDTVLVSHSHMDHVRDLATLVDNRTQLGAGPLTVAATKETIAHLRRHFFNDILWPNFAVIPEGEPAVVYREIPLEQPTEIMSYKVTAIAVNHTVESAGFILEDDAGAIAFSGDTGPTDRFWQLISKHPRLRALLVEVSFPNREQTLATASGHHTPATLAADLAKYTAHQELPTMLYHIKPPFQAEVEKECARLKKVNLQILKLKDQFIL